MLADIAEFRCRSLSEAINTLKINSAVTTLNLSGIEIGNEGAIALGEALKFNSTVTTFDLDGNKIGDEGAFAQISASAIIEKELSKNVKTVTELKAFLVYKYCRISLLAYDKHKKQKGGEQRGEKEKYQNQAQDENQYEHQDLGNKRQKIMSSSFSSSLSPSSLFLSLSGAQPSPLLKKKKCKKIGLSLDIVRHISVFLEWEHLQLSREKYKVSPVSILTLLVGSGHGSDEFFRILVWIYRG